MRADPRFVGQPGGFWALVRTISEKLGYTERPARGSARGSSKVRVHTVEDQAVALSLLGLDPSLVLKDRVPTPLGQLLENYFRYRADVLNTQVQPNLMDAEQAGRLFEKVRARVQPPANFPIPTNKQKGAMCAPAYLTGLVNMLVYEAIGDQACDYAPGQLTTFTRNGVPLRTLARRVDGAFPSAVNPIAVWEIKEYYYTTTFGSRVADGVYETLLDGLELDELKRSEGVRAEHVLIVDAHYTWWVCGKSYLCRMIDMLNMGNVSEVLFGREVTCRVPALARGWVNALNARGGQHV